MHNARRIALVTLSVIAASVALEVDMTEQNTAYIQSLEYDLDTLLAANYTPTGLRDTTWVVKEGGRTVRIRRIARNLKSEIDELALLNPSGGVVYPGAVLKQDRTLAEGLPTPYTLARGPLTIQVDLPGLGDSGFATIESPTNVTVEAGIQKILNYWLNEVSEKGGYRPPVRALSSCQKCYSREQIGVALGFGAQWGRSSAKLGLDVQSDEKRTAFYGAFRQVYYTVTIEEPGKPGAVFARGAELDTRTMPASQPPGLVRSVDYGRIIIVQMTTTSQALDQNAEAVFNYRTLGTKLSGDLKEHYSKHAGDYQFKALVLGGGPQTSALLTGDLDKLPEAIAAGVEFSKSNPGYPVSYKVVDLKSRATSTMKNTTDYYETVREEVPPGPDRTIHFWNKGWFDAKFFVDYKDGEGKEVQESSGKMSKGAKRNITLPGNATDTRVTPQCWNGSSWSSEKAEFIGTLGGDMEVRIGGKLPPFGTVKVYYMR